MMRESWLEKRKKEDRLKANLLDYYTGRELVCTDYLDNEGNIEIKRGYQM